MLRWAVTFLVVALVAAVFGFGGIAGAATDIARVLFFVFVVMFIISSFGASRRAPQGEPHR
jgi:uncharacterized membrane protein YtjA (UPF0391 family)